MPQRTKRKRVIIMKNTKSAIIKATRTSALTLLCIALNVAGSIFADKHTLPAVLDSFGTILSAYILGPLCGAAVGCASTVITSFWSGRSAAYCITGILIGISVGIAARRKHFATIFHAMTVAGLVTMVSVVFSTILNIIFSDGNIGNIWGNGVKDFLIDKNFPGILASFIGQFYLEFTDKLISVVSMFFLISLIRHIRKKIMADPESEDGQKKDSSEAGKAAAALLTVLLIFVSVSPLGLSANADADTSEDNSSYIRTVYNGDNGLPCGHANDVIQTNDGILWVGSYSGLYRYNGSNFRFMNEFDTVKNVNCMYVDNEGRLWIGTNDNGVVLSINETVTSHLDDTLGLPNNSVRCITQSADGDYYIGTSDTMIVARLKTGISVVKTLDDILYAKKTSSDDNGNVAVTTAAGKLYILRKGDVAYEVNDANKDTNFTCCSFDRNNNLYAGTADGRILYYSIGYKNANKTGEINCEGLTGLNCIYTDDDTPNKVWVLADNGIGTVVNKTKYEHLETEGFNYSLEKMTKDYQGNLWIASSRMGLMQLSASPFTDLFAEYGLESRVVNTTELKDKLLYIGTDGGLIIIDTETGAHIENELTKTLEEARVRCIKNDTKNNLWICSYGCGLIEIKPDGKTLRFDKDEYGIGSRVRVCIELDDGTIAVGGDKGLYFLKNDKIQRSMLYGEELGAAKILSLYEMPDGKLYAGTDGNGISVINDGKVEQNYTRNEGLTSDVILRIVGDVDPKNIFIATGNGLCYLKDGSISTFSNFPYSNNFDLILDDDGDLFVPGSAGIYVCKRNDLVSMRNFDYIILNSKAGLMGSLTSNAWNAVDQDKNVYLSTDRGVYSVNLDAYQMKRRFYRLKISEILLDGKSVPNRRGSGLTIGNEVKSIELVPEIINYTLENPSISYRLEGLDTEWKTVSQSDLSHIVYTNLPAGEYEFRLAIRDPESGNILEESSYRFQKDMAIYNNSWFMIYMIVIGGIFVGWLTWFLTRVQMQRTMEIQQTKLALALQQVQMGNETILAIAKTVDAKDLRTSQHSQRVSEYSVKIAAKFGFNKDELENLRKSALLHDIGKIGIPDAILNKPSRLTDEEYAIMKTHVTRGAEILKDFTLIDHAVDGARYHHERYDGHGYPDNLKGKEIPLYGRIIAIADAFDAMTANRVYRQRQDFDYVMDELHKGRGTQFDPELLDIFLELIDSGEIDIDSLYNKNKKEGGSDNAEKDS